ncbi:MAG: phosphoethanolamine transferase [Burkholderiaceae bacterium]
MNRIFRWQLPFLVLTYLALSAVPFFPLVLGQPVAHPLAIAVGEAAAWLAVWALFGRPARFHWLLLPAFLALPLQLYLRRYYMQDLSAHHLGILLETSPEEALEFLSGKVLAAALVWLTALVWWWQGLRAARGTDRLDWRGWSRLAAVLALSAGGLAQFGGIPSIDVWARADAGAPSAVVPEQAPAALLRVKTNAADTAASTTPARSWWQNALTRLENSDEADRFGATWPFGLAVPVYQAWKEREYLARLSAESAAFRFGATQASHAEDPQTVVMVIGESSRYDRWGLNGYGRDTTPLLAREPNLVSLRDMVTPVSATRLSVPLIVTRKPVQESLIPGFSERSFLSAYREAGFKTWWLSNQMSFGKFDTPVSVYADEADVKRFVNLGSLSAGASRDDALLAPLRQALADPARKKLIVLHTLGSHWNYSERYPAAFDRWRPSLRGVDHPAYTDLAIKERLNNSYDDSILYTDWFLAQVIDALKARAEMTSMFYVADHGQTLYDGSCRLAFHGHNTQYEFHVPALTWVSDRYREAFPSKVAQLLRHRDARLSTSNVFPSLLDLSDIRFPTQQLDRSIFSDAFRPHKRYVDSYGWTDYDNATLRGDCHEVIDRGKPLAQRK